MSKQKLKIQPTPRDHQPDPIIRGDKISGERYYSKDFYNYLHSVCIFNYNLRTETTLK